MLLFSSICIYLAKHGRSCGCPPPLQSFNIWLGEENVSKNTHLILTICLIDLVQGYMCHVPTQTSIPEKLALIVDSYFPILPALLLVNFSLSGFFVLQFQLPTILTKEQV